MSKYTKFITLTAAIAKSKEDDDTELAKVINSIHPRTLSRILTKVGYRTIGELQEVKESGSPWWLIDGIGRGMSSAIDSLIDVITDKVTACAVEVKPTGNEQTYRELCDWHEAELLAIYPRELISAVSNMVTINIVKVNFINVLSNPASRVTLSYMANDPQFVALALWAYTENMILRGTPMGEPTMQDLLRLYVPAIHAANMSEQVKLPPAVPVDISAAQLTFNALTRAREHSITLTDGEQIRALVYLHHAFQQGVVSASGVPTKALPMVANDKIVGHSIQMNDLLTDKDAAVNTVMELRNKLAGYLVQVQELQDICDNEKRENVRLSEKLSNIRLATAILVSLNK